MWSSAWRAITRVRLRRQRLADQRERVVDDLAALAIADRPQLGARVDEEQRVVEARRERELVALEHERAAAGTTSVDSTACARIVDRDLLDARVVRARAPSDRRRAIGIGAPTCSSPPATSGLTNVARGTRGRAGAPSLARYLPGRQQLAIGRVGEAPQREPADRVVDDLRLGRRLGARSPSTSAALDLELRERAALERRERALADLERPCRRRVNTVTTPAAWPSARASTSGDTRGTTSMPSGTSRPGVSSHSSWPSGMTSRFSRADRRGCRDR